MSPMSMPKPSDRAKAAFTALLPKDPAIRTRPMFGNLAAFVNGNMFAGLFGEDLFVRLPDGERAQVKAKGGKDFEPMPGRAMTGYVCVTGSWQRAPEGARPWIARSLDVTRRLPPKGAKAEAAKSAAASRAKPKAASKPRGRAS